MSQTHHDMCVKPDVGSEMVESEQKLEEGMEEGDREGGRKGEREREREREGKRERDSPWGTCLDIITVCSHSIGHSLPSLLSHLNTHDIQSP